MIAVRALGSVLAAACAVTIVTGDRAPAAAGDPGDLQSRPPKVRPMPTLPTPIDDLEPRVTEKGNPLWRIPLSIMQATRERPIFSPLRRPPPAQPVAPPPQIVKAEAPSESNEPALNLIGVVVGDREGYAVFLDNTSHAIVRLKTGEGEGGWILRSVANREVVLERNHRTAVMRLPSPMGDHK